MGHISSWRGLYQDLEKLQNKKPLHIKQRYGFDKVVHDDESYEANVIEETMNLLPLSMLLHQNRILIG